MFLRRKEGNSFQESKKPRENKRRRKLLPQKEILGKERKKIISEGRIKKENRR